MTAILGLVMFYAWIHSVIIITKKLVGKLVGLTSYEVVVLWVGLIAFVLFVLGAIAK